MVGLQIAETACTLADGITPDADRPEMKNERALHVIERVKNKLTGEQSFESSVDLTDACIPQAATSSSISYCRFRIKSSSS